MSFKSVLIISCIACAFRIVVKFFKHLKVFFKLLKCYHLGFFQKASDVFDCDKVPPNITMNMEVKLIKEF